uniref:hypothetical protein n=1 Tax=Klebsiella pneumoniae TaxID=573 RepID=UPI001D0E916B
HGKFRYNRQNSPHSELACKNTRVNDHIQVPHSITEIVWHTALRLKNVMGKIEIDLMILTQNSHSPV